MSHATGAHAVGAHTARRTAMAAALLLLGGCALPGAADRAPQVTQMRIEPRTIPEAAQVSVPMPAMAPLPPAGRAQGASLWQPTEAGFFADRRAGEVGDILTIDIEIDDQAQLSNDTERRRQGGASIGAPRVFGLERVLEGLSRAGGADVDIVDVGAEARGGGSGSIDRAESISLKVAATVVQKLPNGNLVVAGRQEVMVNAELRELRVAGIIRPADILYDNTIPYDKIAEARITYGGYGQLSRQTRTAYGEGALDVVLPY